MSVTRVTDAIFVRECSKALRSTVLQLVLTLLGYRNGSCRLAQVTISIRQMVFLTSCTESSLAEHLAVSDCFTNQNCNASCAVWTFTRQHEPQNTFVQQQRCTCCADHEPCIA